MTPALCLSQNYCVACKTHVEDSEIAGVEYDYTNPDHYDGVSEWTHMVCGRREGRWTGRELIGEDTEAKYGGRRRAG